MATSGLVSESCERGCQAHGLYLAGSPLRLEEPQELTGEHKGLRAAQTGRVIVIQDG